MTPLEITLTNFGPFKKTQTFRFPRGPGLFFLWGENQEEPRLEANGAGKSRLWEAFTWLLYNKTSKGLKAGEISNWDVGKNTAVELTYLVDGDEGLCCKLRRSWAPISWTFTDWAGEVHDLTKGEANSVMADVRMGFTPFLHSILMAQGQPMFLDLKEGPKAELFASVMQLDAWLEYSAKASKMAQDQDRVTRVLEQRLATAQGRLGALQDASTAEQEEQWQKERSQRLTALETDYKVLLDQRSDWLQSQEPLKKACDWARDAYRQQLMLVEAGEAAESKERAIVQEIDRDLAKVEQRIATINETLKEQSNFDECPTCGQEISAKVMRELEQQTNATLEQELEHQRALNAELSEASRNLKRTGSKLSENKLLLRELLAAKDQCDRDAARVRLSIDQAERDLDKMEDRADKLKREVSPYAQIEVRAATERRQLKSQIHRLEQDLDASQASFDIATSWIRWFKEIRLQLIGEALQQLEIEVNSCLNDLGLVNWELRFDIDKETKAGSIQRGFTVTVLSPHNEFPVPWEAWSGGESQRLRVAATQGLANLIRDRTGTQLNLEVWDEPTQHLSPQGVTDLLDSLRDRAQREQRQIWIVDHRSLGYSGFSGSAGVIKSPNGSSHFDLSGLYISQHQQPQDADHAPTRAITPRRRP